MPCVKGIDCFASACLVALATSCLAACADRADAVAKRNAEEGGRAAEEGPAGTECVQPDAAAGEFALAALVARVKPTVVTLRGSLVVEPDEGGDPLAEPPEGSRVARSVGSGFIVGQDGLVLTNDHLVREASTIEVRLADDRRFEVEVLGRDPRLDVALLKLRGAEALPVAELGSSEAIQIGERAIVLGNPFGLGTSVSAGIVSATARAVGPTPFGFLQTDAAINPGNSGGPVFNAAGQVIGIATAMYPNGRGIGFAVPIDEVREVLAELKEKGRVERGQMGIGFQEVTAEIARATRLPARGGAIVTEVEPKSAAARAGLQPGDVITMFDAARIGHARELARALGRRKPGEVVSIGYHRRGQERSVRVELDAQDDTPAPPRARQERARVPPLALSASDGPGGAWVDAVDPRSAAVDGLQPGDLILEMNGDAILGGAQLATRVRTASRGGDILLRVRREGTARYVVIRTP